MSGVEGRAGDEIKASPREMVGRVLGDIKTDYKRRRGKTKARLDSLRLSTARMLSEQANPGPGLSEFAKSAIKATEQALIGNWEPMGGYVEFEILAAQMAIGLTGAGLVIGETSPALPGLRKLRQSLGEVKNE